MLKANRTLGEQRAVDRPVSRRSQGSSNHGGTTLPPSWPSLPFAPQGEEPRPFESGSPSLPPCHAAGGSSAVWPTWEQDGCVTFSLGNACITTTAAAGGRLQPEVCESLVELRELLHGQFPLAVGFLQLLRLRPELLCGLQNILNKESVVGTTTR